MFRTDRFPPGKRNLGGIPGADRTWARWKEIYRKADMNEKVKKTAQGRQDHFGAHGDFDKETAQEGELPQLSVSELDRYFRSLANAATTEKYILAALVKSNVALIISNASLTATIADLKKN